MVWVRTRWQLLAPIIPFNFKGVNIPIFVLMSGFQYCCDVIE